MSLAGQAGSHLPAIFLANVQRQPDATAAITFDGGHWREATWADLDLRARALALGLLARGIAPGDRVGILGRTSLTWVLCELAVHEAGAISVPIYPSLPAAEVAYIVRDAGLRLCFVEDRDHAARLLEARGEMPDLEGIVLMEGEGDGEWISDLPHLRSRGERVARERPGAVDDRIAGLEAGAPAHFIYTSGTTGRPKGVVLTHANWAFQAEAAQAVGIAQPGDVGLLFLPLAHAYAQVLKTLWFSLGHPAAFARSLDSIAEDMAEIRPTLMAGVPRIFEKIHARVVARGLAQPGVRGRLFAWAMRRFERWAAARIEGRRTFSPGFFLARRLVFRRIAAELRSRLGGRLRFFVSGGAPLAPTLAIFFDLCGVEILEGYGLTETAAAATVNRPGEGRIGTVGPPIPGVEVSIAEDGEVLVRGPNVMLGYHGRPEATAEVLDPEGWFHTGDLGSLDADGFLRITGRKKDLIVTAGGKNVAPQKIESALKAHPLISQVLVHGDRRKYLTALITLDEAAAAAFAEREGLAMRALPGLANEPAIVAEVAAAVERVNRTLASYETIKRYAILDYELSEAGGELTPSLKVKRRVLEERHAAILDGFYDEKY